MKLIGFFDETGFYFLQTRYYNPQWARFLNADSYFIAGDDELNSANMYVYCNGNSVMYIDPTGEFIILLLIFIGYMLSLTEDDTKVHSAYVEAIPLGAGLLGGAVMGPFGWIIIGSAALGLGIIWIGTKIDFSRGKSNPRDLEKGMTPKQKGEFQRLIENEKKYSGKPPNYNLPWETLVILAEIARQKK